jgi:hypothetical protein
VIREVQQISANGYKLKHNIPNSVKNKLFNHTTQFNPITEAWHLGGYRESWWLEPDRDIVRNEIAGRFSSLDIDKQKVQAVEIWFDYAGYENAMHHDDPDSVRNIIMLYLGEESNSESMGTYWYENDIKYEVDYEVNTGLMLLNSHTIQHGMKGKVPDNVIRKSLYVNF